MLSIGENFRHRSQAETAKTVMAFLGETSSAPAEAARRR
jgi:hypothetical protein